MPGETQSQPTERERKTYTAPSLRVFGSVAAITAQMTRDKGEMDSGSNKFKT
jgi:hypothetical protein